MVPGTPKAFCKGGEVAGTLAFRVKHHWVQITTLPPLSCDLGKFT